MNGEIEYRSRQRRVVLMVMASAFLVWQVPYMDAFARLQESGEPIIQGLSLAGFLVWAAGLVYLLAKSRILVRTASPEVRSALEDELVQANRRKAFHAGYWAMLGAAAVMFAVSQFRPVSGADAAHAVLIAGVAVPMYAFAILERVNA